MYSDCVFSDLHKDVYGFRPRGSEMEQWHAMNAKQKETVWNSLCEELEDNMKREKALERQNVACFESRVEDVIKLGAGDRQTALRWIASQETFYHIQDIEHFVWEQGLLSSFAYNYGKALAKELVDIVEFEDMEWA